MRLKNKGGLLPLWASVGLLGAWGAGLVALNQSVAPLWAQSPSEFSLSPPVDATDSEPGQFALLPPPRRHESAPPPDASATQPSTTQPVATTQESSPIAPVEPPSPVGPIDIPVAKGFYGNNTVQPRGPATGDDFLPLPDRYRIGIPSDYVQNTRQGTTPWLNPYNQNILKGDYPVLDSDKFLILTVTSDTLIQAQRLPVPSGVSTASSGSEQFFGRGPSQFYQENLIVSTEFFKGDTLGYQPRDYQFVFTPVFNGNYLHAEELGVVSPDVRNGRDRTDSQVGYQEAFFEKRLGDLSPNYDVWFVRIGIQPFNSDFRGFLYSDNELGVRFFGNYDNNKTQWNLAWFTQLEKQTDTGLNNLTLRGQDVYIANVYRQDFLFKGYTAQLSAQANLDDSKPHLDDNGFPVVPAPIGTDRETNVRAYYLGWAGDGHIGRLNLTHQFYQAFGTESFNPIAGRPVNIDARFFAVELSYDKDYSRYRASFAYASGDHNPTGGTASGFDSIFDNPNFAGGSTSLFVRQAIALTGTGVNLTGNNSLLPDLRTSKEQGQANFVNPGLLLYNLGYDIDVTPKVKIITNVNWLQFDTTAPLKLLLQDNKISRDIGLDYSIGLQYRPFLNQNAIITFGAAALTPANGFKDLYTGQTLYSFFTSVTLTY